jgi:hypothetical protein
MRKTLWIVFILMAQMGMGQTTFSGGIYSDTNWTLANSPYILDGSVVIFPGKTLTIEPGVEVRVLADQSANIGNFRYIEIRGSLVALGTPEVPIRFTSTLPDEGFNWLGIRIKGSQGGNVTMDYFELSYTFYGLHNDIAEPGIGYVFNGCSFIGNNYGLQLNADLEYNDCLFEGNGVGQASQLVYGSLKANNTIFQDNFCAFTWVYSQAMVTNCSFIGNTNTILGTAGLFQNCLFASNEYGMLETGGVTIENCVFSENGTGIDNISYSTITNCQFTNNGVGLKVGDQTVLTGNDISLNQTGLIINPTNPASLVLTENMICNNILHNLVNGTDKNFDLGENCFCSTDSTTIENSILDGYDDISLGLVNYAIYDDSCEVVQTYVTKVIIQQPNSFSLDDQANLEVRMAGDRRVELVGFAGNYFKVMDPMGRMVRVFSIEPGAQTVSLSGLSSGLYFMISNRKESIRFLLP